MRGTRLKKKIIKLLLTPQFYAINHCSETVIKRLWKWEKNTPRDMNENRTISRKAKNSIEIKSLRITLCY